MDINSTCQKLLRILNEDPNKESYNEKEVGKEYLYTLRLLDWIKKLEPEMSDELRVATCGHHIYRWSIPRDKYAMDKQGYNEWRMKLVYMHANETARILEEEAYAPSFVTRVKNIILKKNLKNDREVQVFEDAINLTFLEFYMDPFSKKHEYSKLVDISAKIMRKMSRESIDLALELSLSTEISRILSEAIKMI